jgi:hypothetical protein
VIHKVVQWKVLNEAEEIFEHKKMKKIIRLRMKNSERGH